MIEVAEKRLTPIGDKIMVKPMEGISKTKAGLFIPDNAKDTPLCGEVLAAGPGRISEQGILMPMPIKEGMTILYTRYAGAQVKNESGQEFLLMSLDDVLAIWNRSPEK